MIVAALIFVLGMQAASTAQQQTTEASSLKVCNIPALTEVTLEVVDKVSSLTAKTGDQFNLKLAEPLELNGRILLQAGLQGTGEVIWAARPKFGGRGGELILAARTLNDESTIIPLRSFRINSAAKQERNFTVFALFGKDWGNQITSENVDVAVGTRGLAKVANSIDVPCE